MVMQLTYREDGKAKCPACQRNVAAVRYGGDLFVSRHLYQESTEVNGIGLPVLNADGFCPGSMHPAPEVLRK